MTTIEPRAHLTFSGRQVLDLATIVTAGLASTVFFLVPTWTYPARSAAPAAMPSPVVAAPTIAAAPTAVAAAIVVPPAAPTSRPRAAVPPRAPKRAPEFVAVKSDPSQQSRIARFLLGDGHEAIRPFPLARQRSER